MTLAGLLIFISAYALAVASPGPAIAAVVANVLGRGIGIAPPFIFGILIGELVLYFTAALGLAALAQTYGTIFQIVKWLGVAYLLYLAWKFWNTNSENIKVDRSPNELPIYRYITAGATLTLGNPKAIGFFVALLPSIIDLRTITMLGVIEVAAIIAIVLPTILAANALSAHYARGFFKSARAIRNLNRVSGTAIAGAAIAIAVRS
jgi:threonine/homoserine/homoserine lactone efflux protein